MTEQVEHKNKVHTLSHTHVGQRSCFRCTETSHAHTWNEQEQNINARSVFDTPEKNHQHRRRMWHAVRLLRCYDLVRMSLE
jgi:hypothetical protein